mmetsp:Transcript_1752/g.2479  ORF Transcript_1752/g.2479 Transcript_1752/m.2479 type:complete len:309 (+) Transcript_1752:193-1119(+)|eukprot:CAMPEP_0184016912 /NCGR_PEP_ID=MMETSP0954-20121128/7206_1 /TAXON_ID=627963 /ORGANISM="Aplanochytrium sp, Strain PBS07" /LENGTH=308 /DNA_ID=CAMNT_0026298013 /DNA_START=96 /DNA_END=1025 /DNA_ORIENTATION=-
MKVYLHYEPEATEEQNQTIKLTLPKSWKNGPASQLQTLLVDSYNKKHKGEVPDDQKLKTESFHLEKKNGEEIARDAPVKKFVENGDDLYLKAGASKTMAELGITLPEQEETEKPTPKRKPLPPTESELETAARAKDKEKSKEDKSKPMCKRFGCQKRYDPATNGPESCRHHVKPPVFHETRKFWACCPDQIAWDWDSFQAIPGCAVAAHSDTREGRSFLGGSDVRAEMEKSGPQRIDQPKDQKSGLDKISKLRKDLVSAGISGSVFDAARDKVKEKTVSEAPETPSDKIWDHVFEGIVRHISSSLEQL